MSMLKSLGARLSGLLEDVGISQAAAARAIGCSAGFLSEVLRGDKLPGADFLFRVREAFGVSTDWLLSGEGQMYARDPIELTTFKLFGSVVDLAHSAVILEEKPQQVMVQRLLNPSRYSDALKDWRKVHRPSDAEERSALTATLYNVGILREDREERTRNAVASAVSYFQTQKETDPSAGLGPSKRSDTKTSWAVLNIGTSIRSAGRDYNEF